MKILVSVIAICGLAAVACYPSIAGAQADDQKLDAAKLKTMISNLGYEPKDLNTEAGKEKYEVPVTKGGFNIPIGAEISPSKNYIWLTISTGLKEEDEAFKTKAGNLLKNNGRIQPSFFYVTSKGFVMLAYPMENHHVTPAWLKKCIEKVSDDLVSTKDDWSK